MEYCHGLLLGLLLSFHASLTRYYVLHIAMESNELWTLNHDILYASAKKFWKVENFLIASHQ